MKKAMVAVVVLAVVLGAAFAEPPKQETDLIGTAIYYKPGQDDDYDNGFGAEAQARFWLNPNVGLSLAAGAASWQANDQEQLVSDGDVAVAASIDGDVTLIPLGGSILFRPVNDDRIALTLEAGVRYVIVDSQVEIEVAAADSSGDLIYAKDTVDIEDGVVGLIGANIEGKVSSQVSLLAGIGYQFDLVRGDAKWMDEDFGDNELKALLVKIGLGIKL